MKYLASYILDFNSVNQQVTKSQKNIENSLFARQNIVGGNIAIFPLTDDIDLIYREDFAALDKKNAWIIYDKQGNEQLILYGTILCLRYHDNDYISLNSNDYETINTLVVPISVFKTNTQQNGKSIVYRKC